MPAVDVANAPERRPGEAAPLAGGGGGGSGALDRLRQDLRGMTFAEGQAALSPRDGAAPTAPSEAEAPATTGATEAPPAVVSGVAAVSPGERRLIRQGSTGDEVTYAQERLNAHGAAPSLAVDGIFGPKTKQATLDYQGSHALAADAIIGPKTWASLDGPTDVGTSAGAGKGSGGGAGAGSKSMLYDTTAYTIAPPPVGTKKADIVAAIDAKQNATPPELGKTIKVEGVQAGSDEELHLYWVISALGDPTRWGSEADIITQIGFPPKTGAAPKGRVTLRIDGEGNATAVLVGPGVPSVAAAFASVADAQKGLKATFGLKDVVDGDATWSLDDLNKVNAAFGRLSSGERASLSGVVLKRMHTLEENGRPLGGKFETHHSLSADGKTATSEATLSLADAAFAGDLKSFIGGGADAAPASFQTILHEVGHAVEEAERYKTREAKFQAQAVENQKIELFNNEVAATNTAITDLNNAINPAAKKMKDWPAADKKAANAYVGAVQGVTTAVSAYAGNAKSADNQKLDDAATKAIAKRDAAKTALQTKAPSNPAPTDFATVEAKQGDLYTAAGKRATALANLDTAKAAHTAAKKADDATQTKGQTNRLKKFADFVKKEKIPEPTEYAKTGIGEFYAESFSFFRTDPEFLKRVAPKLFDWFDKGEHLKP